MQRDAEHPWLTPHWQVSRYNFIPETAVPPHPVELHDVTIRDGEECADLTYSTADKVRIAEALWRAGIRRTELFPSTPGWVEAVRGIRRACPEMDLYVTWNPDRTPRAIDMGVRHVLVWYWGGEAWQTDVRKRSYQQLVDDMLTGVRAARARGAEVVNIFLHETSRSNLANTLAAVQAAEKEGATAVTIVDSHSSARPATIAYIVRQIKAVSGVKVEAHCHNDFGLSVANVLAAYEAGATGLNVTVNGIGYRAGNASLETVVMALEALYGIDTGIRLDMLPELSRLVEEITGLPVGHFQPVVSGRGAFNYEQYGSTAAFIASGRRQIGLPYEPEVVGRSLHLAIGKWSDPAAVVQKLSEYGLTATPEQVDIIRLRSQRLAVGHHRPLTDDEFLAIAEHEGAVTGE